MTEPSKTGNTQDAWARWKFTVLKIGELFDVDTSTAPTSGQALAWNSTDKKWEPATVGSFDPNEDPVIIGSGATSGSGTPSAPSAGVATAVAVGAGAAAATANSVAVGNSAAAGSGVNNGSVAVGYIANAEGHRTVAVGYEASAGGNYGIALGYVATCYASATQAIAIGDAALAQGDNTIAIGDNAGGGPNGGVIEGVALGSNAAFNNTASKTGMTALGALSSVGNNYATVIGYGANDNGANTITLGRSSETVYIYNLYGGDLPTTNPGAGSGLVWNNSGVLTVA